MIPIKTSDEAKALAEELLLLKEHAKRAAEIEKSLREYLEDDNPIEVYHDSKLYRVGFFTPKKTANSLQGPCEWSPGVNQKVFAAMLNYGVKPAAAWRIFKIHKKELLAAVNNVNDPEFTGALVQLATFKDARRWGVRKAGEDSENGNETE